MTRQRPTSPEIRMREESPTAFTPMLEGILRSCPGILAAVFCDEEGEAVDYGTFVDTYEAKVAGAQWGTVLPSLVSRLARLKLGKFEALHVRGEKFDYIVQAVGQGYYVVILLEGGVGWGHALAITGELAAAIRGEGELGNG